MEVNGIRLASSFRDGDATCLVLSCGVADAAALDGKELERTDDDGSGDTLGTCQVTLVERVSDGETRLWFVAAPDAGESVDSLREQVASLTSELSDRDSRIASLESAIDKAKARLSRLGISLSDLGA